MANCSKDKNQVCFLEHQLVKPLAALLVVALLGLLLWVGANHVSYAQAAASGAANGTPILGVQFASPDELVARMFSFPPGEAVLISQINDNSLAARAGLRRGDAITAINGQAVRSPGDAAHYLDQVKQGELLNLTIIRGGLLHDLLLPLGGPFGP